MLPNPAQPTRPERAPLIANYVGRSSLALTMEHCKRWRLVAEVLIGGALAVFAVSCCSSDHHRQVSGAEFLELARAPMGSALHTSFVGATSKRAYLSVWSAMPSSPFGGEDIYSCALSDLPQETVVQIRAGQNPWPK